LAGLSAKSDREWPTISDITNIVDPFNGQTSYTYDQVGRRTQRVLPNGIVTTWQYNWKDQVTNIVHKTSGGTVLASVAWED
jgi:YD repeat-containing protein